jgi:hypothetical protein
LVFKKENNMWSESKSKLEYILVHIHQQYLDDVLPTYLILIMKKKYIYVGEKENWQPE